MIPVDQEFLHDPSNGVQGDCLRACIASVLDLKIVEVPHFAELAKDESTLYFWGLVDDFLEGRGYEYMPNVRRGVTLADALLYHIITGPSPRGNGTVHAVVGLGTTIAHDPHPTRAGLSGDPAHWGHSYILRRNPA